MALYTLHSEDALEEMEEKAFLKNRVHYEQNKEFLSSIRHEALFAAYILTLNLDKINKDDIFLNIEDIQHLPEDIDYFNNDLYKTIYIEYSNYYSTYGNCLFNKWCGFNHIILKELINKSNANEISRWIYKNKDRNSEEFYKQLNNLNNLLFSFITITNHCPSLSVNDMIKLVSEDNEKLFKKIPANNIHLGYHLNEALIDRCINEFDTDCTLYKLYKSGSRFSKIQLARSCINTGYISDDKNIILPRPINSNLLKGLTEEDFFLGSPGSRKGKNIMLF